MPQAIGKKEKLANRGRTVLMYMVLGSNRVGTIKMWYVKATSEEEAWRAAGESGINVSNIMTFSKFTQNYKIEYTPPELRSRQRKTKRKRKA